MDARYRVVSAVESEGFARVVRMRGSAPPDPSAADEERAPRLVTEELSVEDPGRRAIVRLKDGDVVTGTLRGRRLVAARLVRPTDPPEADVRRLSGLLVELAAFGLAVEETAGEIASLEWRRDPKRLQAKHPILGHLLRPRLTWLVGDRDRSDLDAIARSAARSTESLVPRVVVPPLPPRPSEEGDGAKGDARLEAFVAAANGAISALRVPERWNAVGDDWVLGLPEAARLLRDHVYRVISACPF